MGFLLGDVMDQIIDWVYGAGQYRFSGDFLGGPDGQHGCRAFRDGASNPSSSSPIWLGRLRTGVCCIRLGDSIDYQSGRQHQEDSLLNALMLYGISLFSSTTVPTSYARSVSLQASLTSGITGYGSGIDTLATNIINELSTAGTAEKRSAPA